MLNLLQLSFLCCRLDERTLTASFYPKGIEKTSPICRSLSKKDLKFTLCRIIMKFIKLRLSRDIGATAVLQLDWDCLNTEIVTGIEETIAVRLVRTSIYYEQSSSCQKKRKTE